MGTHPRLFPLSPQCPPWSDRFPRCPLSPLWLSLRFPPQNRLPSRGGLIQSRNPRGVRGIEHCLRIFLDFFRDRLHRLDEQVHLFFRLALGGRSEERRV